MGDNRGFIALPYTYSLWTIFMVCVSYMKLDLIDVFSRCDLNLTASIRICLTWVCNCVWNNLILRALNSFSFLMPAEKPRGPMDFSQSACLYVRLLVTLNLYSPYRLNDFVDPFQILYRRSTTIWRVQRRVYYNFRTKLL